MKVCLHCAEELDDWATRCPQCGKDPSVPPAWAVPARSDLPPPPTGSRTRGAGEPWEPRWFPDPITGLPAPGPGQAATGGEAPIHPLVWVALVLTLFGGWILSPVMSTLLRVGTSSPETLGTVRTVVWVAYVSVPVVVCLIAGRQIRRSNGRYSGGTIANVLLVINVVKVAIPLILSLARR